MLALTHTLMGAAGGSVVENVPAAIGLGITFHFLTDKIPHYFPKKMVYKEEIAAVDWLVSTLVIVFLFVKHYPDSVIWGGIAGLAVDVLLIAIPFLRKSRLGEWHIKRQHHKRNPLYLIEDFSLIAISLFVLWRFL